MTRIIRVLALAEAAPAPLEDLAALRARAAARAPGEAGESLGLVLDDPPRVTWGDWPAGGLLGVVRAAAVRLEGLALGEFRPLAEALDSALAAAGAGAPLASRRAVLTAPGGIARALRSNGAQPEGASREARFGASLALLHGAAAAQRSTPAGVLLAEWGAAPPADPPAVWAAPRGTWRAAAGRALAGLEPLILVQPTADAAGALRWLARRAARAGGDAYRPAIHLVLPPGAATHTPADAGCLLGELYGLAQAAGPCPLRVAGAVRAASGGEQIALMATLREYVRARGMRVALVADSWLETPADARAFVEAGAADALHLPVAAFGGVHHLVAAALSARAAGVAVSLDGWAATPLWAQAAPHLAAATGAALLLTTREAGGAQAAAAARRTLHTLMQTAG